MLPSLLRKPFVLLLILSVHIGGLTQIAKDGYNFFKAKNITCDLHHFIHSVNNQTDDDYRLFVQDIKKFCLSSTAAKSTQLLCQMIFIELQMACAMINCTHPVPIRYNIQYTPKQTCLLPKVTLINSWIQRKFSKKEKKLLGSSVINLCSTITSNNETLRLARFFYRMAVKTRRVDLFSNHTQLNKTSVVAPSVKKPIVKNQTKDEDKDEKIHEDKILQDDARNKKIVDDLPEDDLSVNKTEASNRVKPVEKPLLIEADDAEEKNVKIPVRKKSTNETKESEDGVPLGRVGEQPAHEQVNERPKPKALDANVVFKENRQDERNWIDGKNPVDKVEDSLKINLNHVPKVKFDEKPEFVPQQVRKRGPFRLKLSRHSNDDDESAGLSNSFVTSILVLILCMVLLYLILHNKNKVLGLIVEGCRRRRVESRHIRLSQSVH